MRGMRSKAVETKEDLESANTMRLMVSLQSNVLVDSRDICVGGYDKS